MAENSSTVYLGPENATVQFKSKVPFSGRYTILVKFFQPNHSSFDIKVKIDADKLSFDGKLKCRNCPSNSGCREIVMQNGGFKSFEAEENVTVTFMVIFLLYLCHFFHYHQVFE